jgi:hypothetical protein
MSSRTITRRNSYLSFAIGVFMGIDLDMGL